MNKQINNYWMRAFDDGSIAMTSTPMQIRQQTRK